MGSFRRLSVVFVLPLAAFVSCGRIAPKVFVQVVDRKPPMQVQSFPNAVAAGDAASSLMLRERVWAAGVLLAEVQPHILPVDPRSAVDPTQSAGTPASIASVMSCIRDHESGNYNEQSHLSDGSGAYQFVPGTWQAWSARAGYSGYRYAFEAPPAVQDAVTAYTLTHGGAGNWSNRYGFDPCTQGMGG